MRDACVMLNRSLLAILWILLIAIGGCSSPESPEKYEVPDESEPTTGMMYVLPGRVKPDRVAALSSNTFQSWYRYSAEERSWLVQSNTTAYYRDVLVGGETYISGAVDGDVWTASAVRPDGLTVSWGTITFYSEYNGQQNCFVTSNWVICNATSVYILWYATSQCVEPGQWTMRFFNNGVQFHEGTFKVLPEIPPGKVPLQNQLSYSDQYANRCWKAGSSPRRTAVCDEVNTEEATIAQLGCFLVGSCMILGYHGVTVDPPTLNTWLNNNNGYQLGLVDGNAVARYARTVGGVDVFYAGRDKLSNLVGKVCSRGPQLANVRKPNRTRYHHFVTVTGENEQRTTYKINDPAGGTAILLTNKYKDIGSIRVFEGPEYIFRDELNGITIRFHSPGELLLTSPEGLRLGSDPLTGQVFDEIPYGSYVEVLIEDPLDENSGQESKTLEVMRPETGEYVLTVTGTGEGTYDLSVRNYDIQGGPSTGTFYDVPITPDAVHSYALDFDDTPGAEVELGGGFDGGGQRPRDVNKFLSYSTVSSNRVVMPAGATSFALLVVYGSAIFPDTFMASLDRTDVSGLFSAAPGSSEIVSIPLHGGRNVLTLSVRGSVPGRTARDVDRIVFLVPEVSGN